MSALSGHTAYQKVNLRADQRIPPRVLNACAPAIRRASCQMLTSSRAALLVLKKGPEARLSRRSTFSREIRRLACCGAAGSSERSLRAARTHQAGRADARSGRAPFVAMMQAPYLGDRHDDASVQRRDRTRNRRVLVERQMCAGPFVVRTILRHQLLHARFIQRDDMIETLATSGSDKSFDEWVLPRRARRRQH